MKVKETTTHPPRCWRFRIPGGQIQEIAWNDVGLLAESDHNGSFVLWWSEWKLLSCVWLFVTPQTIQSMEFSRQNTGVGRLSLLQGIFPTQRSNPGFPHCRWILYQLSHKVSQSILEWVAYPFPRGSSWPRNQTRVPCIAGGFFTNWAIREAHRKVHQ